MTTQPTRLEVRANMEIEMECPTCGTLCVSSGEDDWTPVELLSASKPAAESDEQADLAFSVYSGLNALRWLLNLTTEFDRKDVRTRQAARLLDGYTDSFGKTNRERLEDMWKTLNDKLPDDGRINEYLRAHDAAGRALKAKGSEQ